MTLLHSQADVLILPLTLARAVVRSGLVVSTDLVLVDGQTFQANRSTGVNLVGADSDLSTETIAHAICETSRGIPVYACGVDFAHEALSFSRIGRHNAVGVARGVVIDVVNCVLKR